MTVGRTLATRATFERTVSVQMLTLLVLGVLLLGGLAGFMGPPTPRSGSSLVPARAAPHVEARPATNYYTLSFVESGRWPERSGTSRSPRATRTRPSRIGPPTSISPSRRGPTGTPRPPQAISPHGVALREWLGSVDSRCVQPTSHRDVQRVRPNGWNVLVGQPDLCDKFHSDDNEYERHRELPRAQRFLLVFDRLCEGCRTNPSFGKSYRPRRERVDLDSIYPTAEHVFGNLQRDGSAKQLDLDGICHRHPLQWNSEQRAEQLDDHLRCLRERDVPIHCRLGRGLRTVPGSGNVSVQGGNVSVNVRFLLQPTYVVTFKESGLPFGTNWTLYVYSGWTPSINSSSTSTITFRLANGSYSWSAIAWFGGGPVNRSVNTSGGVLVAGAPVSVSVQFPSQNLVYGVTFAETGLPSQTNWSVTFAGVSRSANYNGSIHTAVGFSLSNGTYSYSIPSVGSYAPNPGSGSVTVAGSSVHVSLKFSKPAGYGVQFTESGLPKGSNWSVYLNGASTSSTSTNLSFSESNGTYRWAASALVNRSSVNTSGNVTVAGAATHVNVSFQVPAVLVKLTFEESRPGPRNELVGDPLGDRPRSHHRGARQRDPLVRRCGHRGLPSVDGDLHLYDYRPGAPILVELGKGHRNPTDRSGQLRPERGRHDLEQHGRCPPGLGRRGIGIAFLLIGACGLALTAYRSRSRQKLRGQRLVARISESEWTKDSNGEPTLRASTVISTRRLPQPPKTLPGGTAGWWTRPPAPNWQRGGDVGLACGRLRRRGTSPGDGAATGGQPVRPRARHLGPVRAAPATVSEFEPTQEELPVSRAHPPPHLSAAPVRADGDRPRVAHPGRDGGGARGQPARGLQRTPSVGRRWSPPGRAGSRPPKITASEGLSADPARGVLGPSDPREHGSLSGAQGPATEPARALSKGYIETLGWPTP